MTTLQDDELAMLLELVQLGQEAVAGLVARTEALERAAGVHDDALAAIEAHAAAASADLRPAGTSALRAGWEELLGEPAPATPLPPTVRAVSDVGFLLLAADDEVMTPWIRHYRSWEPAEGELLRAEIPAGGCVLDVGANLGYHSLLAARAVGDGGEVIAVEPDPDNLALLRANLAANGAGNVTVVPAAAAASTGRAALHRSADNRGDHRLDRGGDGIDVPVLALDDVLDPEVRIDVVKVDVQGRDHLVLRGLRRTLERHRPLVVTEFSPPAIRELGDDPGLVLAELLGLGFDVTVLETGSPATVRLVADLEAAGEELATLVLRP